MTLKPNSKLKPSNIKQIRPKPRHIPNKKSDSFSKKIFSSPTTLFKIDIKDLMFTEHNCSKTNVNNEMYNNNNIKADTKNKMNRETFMECLDKFLGFNRCSNMKKRNFNVCEIKHRPFNKYSYFNNKDNNNTHVNNNNQSYRFNTVSGWKGRKELSVNNSMSVCGKKQESFYQLSTGKKDVCYNKNAKKKKMKENKKKLTYEFGDDFFDDKKKYSKKLIVVDDINENNINEKDKKEYQDKDKDNMNVSDSVQYLSACSSHHSQED